VGSGPFQLDEWNKGTSISFVRNENYWDPEHPLLDAVVWNFVTDDNARVLQLKSGQTQQIDSVPWTEVEGLQGQDGVVVDSLAVPSWVLLSLNHQQPEFQDLNVRMALSMAIDREAINQTLYSGLGTVPNSILPALRFDAPADEVAPIQFDMDAARALLGESAFPEGFEARLEFPADSAAFQTLAVLLQAAWGELGVTVTLHPEDQGTLSQSFRDGTYDMILPYALAVSDVIVPDEFAGFYGIPGDTNAFFSWWENPEIAALVDEFIHTADDEVRAEQWPVIQAAMQEQQPVLNVMNLPFVKARDENVCDNFATAIGYDSLLFTWIAE
jgi:peptide/nickel transport system substrate-binding protein